jgi:hypothetical protein
MGILQLKFVSLIIILNYNSFLTVVLSVRIKTEPKQQSPLSGLIVPQMSRLFELFPTNCLINMHFFLEHQFIWPKSNYALQPIQLSFFCPASLESWIMSQQQYFPNLKSTEKMTHWYCNVTQQWKYTSAGRVKKQFKKPLPHHGLCELSFTFTAIVKPDARLETNAFTKPMLKFITNTRKDVTNIFIHPPKGRLYFFQLKSYSNFYNWFEVSTSFSKKQKNGGDLVNFNRVFYFCTKCLDFFSVETEILANLDDPKGSRILISSILDKSKNFLVARLESREGFKEHTFSNLEEFFRSHEMNSYSEFRKRLHLITKHYKDIQPLDIIYPALIENVLNFTKIMILYEQPKMFFGRRICPESDVEELGMCTTLRDNELSPHRAIHDPEYYSYAKSWISTHSLSYIFLSCSSSLQRQEVLSYRFYTIPLDFGIWICMALTSIAMATLIIIYWQRTKKRNANNKTLKRGPFQLVFLIWATLIDIDPRLRQMFPSLDKISIVFAVWFMGCLVLNSSYKGILTQILIAPKYNNSPSTWSQLLLNTSFLILPIQNERILFNTTDIPLNSLSARYITSQFQQDLLKFYRGIKGEWFPPLPPIEVELLIRNPLIFERNKGLAELAINRSIPRRSMQIHPYNYTEAEDEASKCDETAFVDYSEVFEKYLSKGFPTRSKRTGALYRKSKDTFLDGTSHISYTDYRNPIIIRRLRNALEAGLYTFWKNFRSYLIVIKSFRFQAMARNNKPLAMEFGIFTLFIGLIGLLIVSCVAFAYEHLKYWTYKWKMCPCRSCSVL